MPRTIEPTAPATIIPAVGCMSEAEDQLAELLASLASVQTFLNCGSAAVAAHRIYIDGIPEPAAEDGETYTVEDWINLYPCLILSLNAENGYAITRTAFGTTAEFVPSAVFDVSIERLIPQSEIGDIPLMMRTFKNHIGPIITELGDNTGPGGYEFTSIRAGQIHHTEIEQSNDVAFVRLEPAYQIAAIQKCMLTIVAGGGA